jgi:hypothetical protein
VAALLSRFGEVSEDDTGLKFKPVEPAMADHVTVRMSPEGGVSSLSFSRPGPAELLRPLLFAAISELGMTFFTQDADVVWVAPAQSGDIPAPLRAAAEMRHVRQSHEAWA